MSLKGAATWPSFPSDHGVLSVRAYPPFRGRAVSRGCRTQGCDGAGPASNIRVSEKRASRSLRFLYMLTRTLFRPASCSFSSAQVLFFEGSAPPSHYFR